ncbi:YheC/YheD family protein [Brevibacillus sp. TJ4]|uniref:YheC/YheD family endospore coat-associated protein n=1 Tax=Brevibacillus sp. TJ4 TaxID=3234853 RepID=UPI0037D24087
MNRIGIMLDWGVMEKGKNGERSYERIPYYVEIGKELGLQPVFFHPRHVQKGDNVVQGYFWNGSRLIPRLVSVPKVIHNRVLTGDAKARAVISRLSRKRKVFNGLVVRDKRKVHQLLWKNKQLRPYLPYSTPYTAEALRRFLDQYPIVYIKPTIGSVGIGVARIERHGNEYMFISSKMRRLLPRKQLLSLVRRWVGPRRFLLQQGISLARYEDKTFDIRVSVQKNGENEWVVSGMVAKVANKKNKLSNLSRGGKAVPLSVAMKPTFTEEQQEETIARIETAAIRIAAEYARHFPSLADLGMDMGIDRQGNPYLIEVNVRDQRYSFFKAGEKEMFKQTYRCPMEYALSLIQGNAGKGRTKKYVS